MLGRHLRFGNLRADLGTAFSISASWRRTRTVRRRDAIVDENLAA
jgi:hypothetical protein